MSALLAWIGSLFLVGGLAANDRVVVAPPETTGEIILQGEIIDLIGGSVRIRGPADTGVQVIPFSQVVRIETTYHPDHLAGLARLAAGETREAEQLLQAAYEREVRAWVRRELLSYLVRCAQRRYDPLTATTRFLQIVREDPHTAYWSVAPLPWTPEAVPEALKSEARQLITRTQEAERLLGASRLLFDPIYGESARSIVRELSLGSHRQVSGLAAAQLWRVRLGEGNLTPLELSSWRSHVERLPRELRSGPQVVLASGFVRQGDYQQAAAEWLWVALTYSEQDPLTSLATYEAAESLLRLGKTEEARTLFSETVQRFPWSREAGPARQRLANLDAPP